MARLRAILDDVNFQEKVTNMDRSTERAKSATPDRRAFIKGTSSAILVGGSLALSRAAHASGDDTIKVGLVGCGGRGKGAAQNAMKADDNAKLVALCEIFPDRLENAKRDLSRSLKDRYAVPDDQCFSGFDGYKKLIDSDVDVVLLCTPPHFRPAQLRAAVEAGKHVFCEKPVAVDATGVRHVLDTAQMAKKMDLSLVSGLCWRYDHAVRETMQRIFDGAIGDIVAIQENYLTTTLWQRPRKPEWSEMEYQIRNWLYYTWLSGDHIVEQHIHSLDKALWLMGDQPPAKCFGLGGRQVRTDPKFGHIFDHFAVCYEWDNGVKTFAYTRQMKDCFNDVGRLCVGYQGTCGCVASPNRG